MRKDRIPPAAVIQPGTKYPKPSDALPKGWWKSVAHPEHKMFIVSVMESSACYFLDTCYGVDETVEITRKQGDGTPQVLKVPKAMADYNAYMGGVDAFDSVRRGDFAFEKSHKCSKWTVRLFEALLSMCLANAWNIWRFHHEQSKGDHFRFLVDVFKGLIREHCEVDPEGSRSAALAHSSAPVRSTSTSKKHTCVQTMPGTRGGGASSNSRYTAKCVECDGRTRSGDKNHKTRTTWFCSRCLVFCHPECMATLHEGLEPEFTWRPHQFFCQSTGNKMLREMALKAPPIADGGAASDSE